MDFWTLATVVFCIGIAATVYARATNEIHREDVLSCIIVSAICAVIAPVVVTVAFMAAILFGLSYFINLFGDHVQTKREPKD